MGSEGGTTWTIKELGERVAAALAHDYQGPDNGQIRAVPNTRTIRYYASIGLVDPPLEMRGRTAIYGRRHLEQLVAVKRLQARGLSLAEVQEKLHGVGPRQLAALAALPARNRRAAEARAPRAPARAFWRSRPVQPAPPAPATSDSVPTPAVAALTAAPLIRVELGPGVSLHIEGEHALSQQQLGRLAQLASPLMNWLDDTRSRAAVESDATTGEGDTP